MDRASRAPAHLWIVGMLGVLWNAYGGYDYLMKQTGNAQYLSQFSAQQQAAFETYPIWMEAAWAFGVWGALIGAFLLLARSRHAVPAFALSLIGLLVATLYHYSFAETPPDMQTTGAVMMNLVIWAVAIFLFGYARAMRAKRVLR